MDFTFEQNQTVDAIDKVPAEFQHFYADAGDGKFKLDDKFKPAAKSVDGLNKANGTLRKGEKTLKEQLQSWTGLGEAPESVKAMIDDLNEKIAAGGKVNPEKIKQDVAASFDGKLKEKDSRIGALTGAVEKYLVTSAATQAIAAQKGVPDLLLPHIKQKVKVVEDKGEFKVVVVDADGETRYSNGAEMTIDQLVAELKKDKVFGRAFESESPSGTGSGSGAGAGAKQAPGAKKDGEKSPVDKIAAGLAARKAG